MIGQYAQQVGLYRLWACLQPIDGRRNPCLGHAQFQGV
jgi:hypothetical protein